MTTKQAVPIYYFAYGSNLNKQQMLERCPENKPRFTAVLPNYKLIFSGWSRQRKGGVASVRAFHGQKVHGGIYEISERDLRRLDSYEGYPTSYSRINVTVFSDDGEAVQAFTYIKTGQVEETPPSPEYVAIIKQGYHDWGIT